MTRCIVFGCLLLQQTGSESERQMGEPFQFPFPNSTPGRVLKVVDQERRFLILREGAPGYVSCETRASKRPDLGFIREVHGSIAFICQEMQGITNPRLIIEVENQKHYQVVFRDSDANALEMFCDALGLLRKEEKRVIDALTIRTSSGGHKLKTSQKVEFRVDDACWTNGNYPLDGATIDDLAKFLEMRLWEPVVNLTGVNGRWQIQLSDQYARTRLKIGERAELDKLGLSLQWERVELVVTVVTELRRTGRVPWPGSRYSETQVRRQRRVPIPRHTSRSKHRSDVDADHANA